MNWFKGEIAEAVASSKAKKAIFVVYVEGKDEKSSQITELINTNDISTILSGENFVAIKIEGDSVPYQQFSQIYKQVAVPSLYFIGENGVPLKIIAEVKDIKTFRDKIDSILQKAGKTATANLSEDFISNEKSQGVPSNVVCENGVCTIQRTVDENKPSTSQQSEPENSTANNEELSVEEKVERAKQLVEKKREEKRREEEEKERQKEIERRKMGQSVQQLKRWQDDQELKQVLEEREKEKRESQAARERVLAQIAQDKAERAAKFSNSPPQQPQVPSQAAPKPPPSTSNTARLQFRMPDGRTATNDFASSETLESVHAYIKGNLNLPFTNYTLSTTFPRREFSDNDGSQSLADLGLVPTAVILILPVNRGAVSTSTGGGVTGLFWSLLTPILALLGYLKTFVFGAGQQSNPNNTDRNKRAADSTIDPRMQSKIRRSGETTIIKRQGNVHRLSNKSDSDDENNTWNGNSTQQM